MAPSISMDQWLQRITGDHARTSRTDFNDGCGARDARRRLKYAVRRVVTHMRDVYLRSPPTSPKSGPRAGLVDEERRWRVLTSRRPIGCEPERAPGSGSRRALRAKPKEIAVADGGSGLGASARRGAPTYRAGAG